MEVDIVILSLSYVHIIFYEFACSYCTEIHLIAILQVTMNWPVTELNSIEWSER